MLSSSVSLGPRRDLFQLRLVVITTKHEPPLDDDHRMFSRETGGYYFSISPTNTVFWRIFEMEKPLDAINKMKVLSYLRIVIILWTEKNILQF